MSKQSKKAGVKRKREHRKIALQRQAIERGLAKRRNKTEHFEKHTLTTVPFVELFHNPFQIYGNTYNRIEDILENETTIQSEHFSCVFCDKYGNYVGCLVEAFPRFDSFDCGDSRCYYYMMVCRTLEELQTKIKYMELHKCSIRHLSSGADHPHFLSLLPFLYWNEGYKLYIYENILDIHDSPTLPYSSDNNGTKQ